MVFHKRSIKGRLPKAYVLNRPTNSKAFTKAVKIKVLLSSHLSMEATETPDGAVDNYPTSRDGKFRTTFISLLLHFIS